MFVNAQAVLHMAVMFLASGLNIGNHKKIRNSYLYQGEILLFRVLANNMAPIHIGDKSHWNHLALFWLSISLFYSALSAIGYELSLS